MKLNKTAYSLPFLFAAAAALALFVIPPHIYPRNYPADDAYFYLQVASNIYHGHGSTFNQITSTNGYHPLWMLVCIGAFFASAGSKIIALHLVIAVQQILALAMIWLFLKITSVARMRFGIIALPLLFLFFTTRLFCSEAYINGFFVLLLLLVSLRKILGEALPDKADLAVIGVLGGFAALARLDNIFVVGTVFLAVFGITLYRRKFTLAEFLLSGISVGAAFLAVVTPYLVLNLYMFGHLAPVSGAIKSTLPHLSFNLGGISMLGKICLAFALASPLLCLLPECGSRKRFVVLTLSDGFILHMSQIIFTTNHHTGWPWYYVSGVLNMAFMVSILSEILLESRLFSKTAIYTKIVSDKNLLPTIIALLVVLINIYSFARYRNPAPTITLKSMLERLHQPAQERWQQAVGDWLRENLPPDSRIMIYDWPGIIAYASGLRILPPDGLINDYRYNEELRSLRTVGYLRQKNITYWLGPTNPTAADNQAWYNLNVTTNGQQIEIFAPLYKESAGSFSISGSNRVARLRDVIHHQDLPDLSLWKIRLPDKTN
jgi:hypothetical protein